jgi:poly-gamma-glutamate synthesis protein (capsule biosynthesis protein)
MNPGKPLELLLVGDVMIGRLVNEVLDYELPEYPWGDTLRLFRQADWRACNLECVISDYGSPWRQTPKAFHFRSDAKNLAVLKAARINAVSLANNHTLDYGRGGMLHMLRLLDDAGITHAGAGDNLVAAAEPAIMEVNGLRIGWISFTDNQPEWEALPDRAGVFYVPVNVRDQDAVKLFELVRYTRQQVNLLIVSAHWGGNWGYSPPREHIEFAHALVRAGADIVFGHSAHVVRGIEIYQGRPIIHSAGDFIDDYAVDPDQRNDRSLIFTVEIEGAIPKRLRLYPTVIEDCAARLAVNFVATEITGKMTELCAEFGTTALWDAEEACLLIECQREKDEQSAARRGQRALPILL